MSDEKQPAAYIMASDRHGTLYVGVTSNLLRRLHQHRDAVLPGFTSRYGCKMLVWYEVHADMAAAILREKQIKGGSRARKIALIEAANPTCTISTTVLAGLRWIASAKRPRNDDVRKSWC